MLTNFHLLKQIGKGKYGDVWLVQDADREFRALKIVHKDRFLGVKPFEREFYGVKKYRPISRQHDGLLEILDVEFDEGEGVFYYTMELADDRECGRQINPKTYKPKSLLSELRARGSFNFNAHLELAIPIVRAVDNLHNSGLVHRDIKPSNIVFLHGKPVLADIGCVKLLDDSISIAGTKGYIPLEGPGRPAGD